MRSSTQKFRRPRKIGQLNAFGRPNKVVDLSRRPKKVAYLKFRQPTAMLTTDHLYNHKII